MTAITPSVPCTHPRSSVLERLALRLGLALIAWARRSSNRVEPTHEQVQLRRAAEREAEQLRVQHAVWVHPYSSGR